MNSPKSLTAFLAAIACVSQANPAYADTFGSGANSFDIEFVTIGNPGNAADTTGFPNPAGSVPHTYRMGKFEISEQMIDKANAEGGLGISKDFRGADMPATSVSWNEAARFVNWLNTSTGSPPAYKFALQPGAAEYTGIYSEITNIELWNPSDAGYDPNNLYRNSLARYFLPSVDEWYKAAYYDPASGVYYDYATGSDTAPVAVTSGKLAGTAVYSTRLEEIGPAEITLAGGLSPYGTMAQNGNVYEWEETALDLVNETGSSRRGMRGGFWNNTSSDLHVSFRWQSFPATSNLSVGFRVASVVPEASTLALIGIAGLGLLGFRRR